MPFYYGWVVVAVAFVTMGIGVNARTAFSLLYPAILDEYGWDRGATAGIFAFGFECKWYRCVVAIAAVAWSVPCCFRFRDADTFAAIAGCFLLELMASTSSPEALGSFR